jgi:hypothetical protein
MKQLKNRIVLILLLTMVSASLLWSGTTGKIAGTVTDKTTGESLIGVNIVVAGTSLGAVSDINGEFTILFVPPGIYSVQISSIGYERATINNVRVYIDQTARIDLAMGTQAIYTNDVVVIGERKTIQQDVATSVAAISEKEVAQLPINSVMSAVGLQAGVRGGWSGNLVGAAQPSFFSGGNYIRGHVNVQGGLNIRGGEGDNILFMVDGVTMRDPRNSEPSTNVALSSVKDISLERGGFSAEYGQVRSGVINVITKEGAKSGYSGSFQVRYMPPGPKYWRGPGTLDIQDPNSYILRPFFDPAVCWTGTDNGAWDQYTKQKYPTFTGWNAISKALCSDNDPNNDLTPLGAQRVFEYETRKVQPNNQPDYDIDAGFGGPVPFVNEVLGNLRFFASYRSTREELLFPLSRPDYHDYNWNVQMISDITSTMKLRIAGMSGKKYTMRGNWDATGSYSYPRYPTDIAGQLNGINGTADLVNVFSDFNLCPSDIGEQSLSAKLTHNINSTTYYEVSLENFRRDYKTDPGALRDTSQKVEVVPGYFEDSNPFGYWPFATTAVILGTGMHESKARDWTVVNSTTLKANFTSQVNFQNMIKAGLEFNYYDLNFDYGTITSGSEGKLFASRVQMRVFPVQGGAYLQDKLETKGFTANLGLRLDYSDPRTAWWDMNKFDPSFFSSAFDPTKVFSTEKFKPQWQLSPRLGIAHPITEDSKLFFNYGHFKQVPQYESLFRVERNDQRQMTSFGNPNLILAKTISYELGYDQILFEDFLLQIAAFYNDISNQQDFTQYISSVAGFAYTKSSSNNYQDSRGIELTLRRTFGRWVSGFVNYTYQVNTTGHFGDSKVYDNPSDQKKWDEATVNVYQDRPVPQPYARLNLTFFTPENWGPSVLSHKILGGWSLNATVDWQAGYWTTWNITGLASTAYNVQAVDFWNTALRVEKSIPIGKFKVQLFMDVSNVLNTLKLWGFDPGNQNDPYMNSLHLPKSDAYPNIPGDDKVGMYRTPGVDWQPELNVRTVDRTRSGEIRPIYYEGVSGQYWQYIDNPNIPVYQRWTKVDQARMDQINRDKAYINMPNASTFWFLDPRNIHFGLKLSFDFTD